MQGNRETLSLKALRASSSEIIPNRLYFSSFNEEPPTSDEVFCFSIDDSLIYENFCLDFGPLNLAQTYHFCNILNQILKHPEHEKKQIHFYSSLKSEFASNAAVLVGAFSILSLGKTSNEAYEPLKQQEGNFAPFHDASYFPCPYILTVKDCLDGIYKAKELKFFNWEQFDVTEYEHFIDLDNGDLNWIVDDKFCAFAGPFEKRKHFGRGYYSTIPSDYTKYFIEKNVSAVIRLNKAHYSAKHYTEAGINHHHLFYPDGGNPPESVLQEFIKICEKEKGAIAVHCKAGLGRTGTCIGMYLMKHHDITAREIIGWFRIARPGSIIGPQQFFLEQNEARMKAAGLAVKKKNRGSNIKYNKRESAQNYDKSRSFTDIKLVNTDDLYVNMNASKKNSEKLRLSFTSFDGVETQGDILNRLKAEHKKKKA